MLERAMNDWPFQKIGLRNLTKCKIVYADSFKKSLKLLQKRYCHVKDDVRRGLDVLQYEPGVG